MALRWHLLLLARGRREPGLWWLFETYSIALLLGQILPTAVGGDAVRAIDLARRTGARPRRVSSVLVDRVVGPRGARRAGGGRRARRRYGHRQRHGDRARPRRRRRCTLIAGRRRCSRSACSRRCAGSCRIADAAARRGAAAGALPARCTPTGTIRARSRSVFVLGVVAQGMRAVSIDFLAAGMGLDIGFATLLVLCPVLFLVTVVPVSLNGIGLREATFVVVLGGAGVVARGRIRARPGVLRGRRASPDARRRWRSLRRAHCGHRGRTGGSSPVT